MSPDRPLAPDPVIEAYKKHVDRTLLRENLRRSVAGRLANLQALQRLADEARRAGRLGGPSAARRSDVDSSPLSFRPRFCPRKGVQVRVQVRVLSPAQFALSAVLFALEYVQVGEVFRPAAGPFVTDQVVAAEERNLAQPERVHRPVAPGLVEVEAAEVGE